MQKAAFSLDNFSFPKVHIDYTKKTGNSEIGIDIQPSGVLIKETSKYKLTFVFIAETELNNPFIKISCEATFSFSNVSTLDEIPSFFYKNSIAILFPYIRAFVSTVSLQANYEPMILPTLNLSSLESMLKEKTSEI